MRPRQLPALVVLVVTALGLALTVTVDAQPGLVVVGMALLLAAGLRMSLTPRRAGWLVVRTRGVDVTFLVGLGIAVVLLANAIPDV